MRVERRPGSPVITALLIAVAACWSAAGCGKRGGGTGSTAGSASAPLHVEGTPHTDAVIGALRGAGMKPDGFTVRVPVPYGASFCEEGRVDAVDTIVCEFRDADSLARGKTALVDGWGRDGGQTGVAFASKLTLIGLVDRGGHDPNGKTISRAVETFRKL